MRQRQIEVLFDEQWYSATIVSYDSAFNAKVRYNDGTDDELQFIGQVLRGILHLDRHRRST